MLQGEYFEKNTCKSYGSCASSKCASQMYEVEISVMVIKLWSGHDFVRDRQTHRQTDRPPDRRKGKGGDIIVKHHLKHLMKFLNAY